MFLKKVVADLSITVFVVLMFGEYIDGKPGRGSRFDETFFMPQSMKEKYIGRILTDKDRTDDLISPWTKNTGSSLEVPTVVPAITSCPWTYAIVYNPNRIPSTILEAVCSTQQCLAPYLLPNATRTDHTAVETSQRGLSNYLNNIQPYNRCKEVKYYRWVSVKTSEILRGKKKFIRRLLPVTVACSCISINRLQAESALSHS